MSQPTQSPARGLNAATFVDPAALMSIRNLELRARSVVQGFWSGLHRSPLQGFSVEFSEYRQYTPGDDPRFVDWRVFARMDKYFVKKFEAETNLRCHMLVDRSRSMSFGSGPVTKAQYTTTLAATLAYFLVHQGDAVGLVQFDSQIREFLPARSQSGHLRHLMFALDQPADGRSSDLNVPMERLVDMIRKRGLIVVFSDFMAPIGQLEKTLLTVMACGHEVILFQILDQAELDLDFAEPSLFEDLETGRTLFVDPAGARPEYRRRLETHLAEVRKLAERVGATCLRLSTKRPIELAMLEFLEERIRRGKSVPKHRT